MERICCRALLLAKVIPTRKAFNLALPQAASGLLTILVFAPHAQEHVQPWNCTLLLIRRSAVYLLFDRLHITLHTTSVLHLHASSLSAGLSQPQACFAVANLLSCNCLLQSYAVLTMH